LKAENGERSKVSRKISDRKATTKVTTKMQNSLQFKGETTTPGGGAPLLEIEKPKHRPSDN